MSVLTHVILVVPEPDDELEVPFVEPLQQWLQEHYASTLEQAHEASGNKVFCDQVWLGCFNHFNYEAFVAELRARPYTDETGECVQCWIKHGVEDRYTETRIEPPNPMEIIDMPPPGPIIIQAWDSVTQQWVPGPPSVEALIDTLAGEEASGEER